MTTLIVTLPEPLPAPSVACAYAVTGDGIGVERHGEATLSLLSLPAGADVVIVDGNTNLFGTLRSQVARWNGLCQSGSG